jgi:hypothetical protein
MTAGKHHAELIVLDVVLKGRRFALQILPEFELVNELRGEVAELLIPPHKIGGPVAGHAHEPGGRIIGKALKRPCFHSPAKGVLNHVLSQV